MENASLLEVGVSFALSMAAGLAIGSERAISNRTAGDGTDEKHMGVRDFALVAILAFVSSLFYAETPLPWVVSFAGILGFSLSAFVIANLRANPPRPVGMTTMLALPTTFLIASLPNFDTQFWVIATIVLVMLLILELKEHLHLFVNTLQKRDIFDFAVLIGIAVSITPLIPHSAQLPIPLLDFSQPDAPEVIYRHISLASLWKVVIMVSLMSFVAHFITKYIQGKNALLLATFFGGLVSSLATIVMLLSHKAEEDSAESTEAGFSSRSSLSRREIFLGFVSANTGSIVKDIILFRLVVGPDMFATFLLPLVSALVLFAVISAYTFSTPGKLHTIHITKRPLPLSFIFKFSVILTVLLVIMQMVTYYMSAESFVLASFLSGCASSAASITAIGAAMVQEGGIGGPWIAGLSLIAALLGSVFAKYLVVARHMGLRRSAPFILPLVAQAAVMLLALSVSLS